MVDTVTVTKIFDGVRTCEYEFTNRSDGTGEAAVKKIDLDDLVGDNGQLTGGRRPSSLTLVKANWTVTGFNHVTALWDRSPPQVVHVMASDSETSYEPVGGKRDPKRDTGGSGDILLTTSGGSSGSSYNIRIKFRKKYL